MNSLLLLLLLLFSAWALLVYLSKDMKNAVITTVFFIIGALTPFTCKVFIEAVVVTGIIILIALILSRKDFRQKTPKIVYIYSIGFYIALLLSYIYKTISI